MTSRPHGLLGLVACLAFASMTAHAQDAATPSAAPTETAAPAPAPAPAEKLNTSNKWRLQVSEGANNDGVLVFRFTPEGGTPQDVTVNLKKGRGEDGCARDIRDTFKAKLDKKTYQVEVDDGEDVLVKKRKGPNFEIKLVEQTVKGTRINFDKE